MFILDTFKPSTIALKYLIAVPMYLFAVPKYLIAVPKYQIAVPN